MAHCGHADSYAQCLLVGVKRTSRQRDAMSPIGPKADLSLQARAAIIYPALRAFCSKTLHPGRAA